nr:oxidoreductase [Mesorhizobium sp.]
MTSNRPVAIVTGASSGIGLETAHALDAKGFRVFGTSRSAREKAGSISMLACDVTDGSSVQRLIADVLTQAGRIDLLVNNAGTGLVGAAEESSIGQAQAIFDINVFGVVRLTKAVLPVMRRQGSGRIVNVSSVLGLIPAPYSALYAATKHAIEGYTESLDHELRAQGIRAVLVEPAFTRTSFEGNALKPDQPSHAHDAIRSRVEGLLREAVAAGDDPAEVALTVVKAATDAAPRLRYAAGKRARQVSLLRRFVPASAFDKSIRKLNGLPA